MRKLLAIAATLLGLLYGQSAKAQGGMQPQYSSYTSVILSSDGKTVTIGASITGYGGSVPVQGSQHTPIVEVGVKNIVFDSTISGQPVVNNQYISFGASYQFPRIDFYGGGTGTWTTASVRCNFVGLFWTVTWGTASSPTQVEVADTLSDIVGGSVGAWRLSTTKSCSTHPPDFNPQTFVSDNPSPVQALGTSICIRGPAVGPNWVCTPGPAFAEVGIIEPYPCTNWDKGIKSPISVSIPWWN